MSVTERVSMHGHILDSGELSSVFNEVLEARADYMIEEFHVGKKTADESTVVLAITAPGQDELEHVLNRIHLFGANVRDPDEARFVEADIAGCFPRRFYSSTNLETEVLIDGDWVQVPNPEMDCALVLQDGVPHTRPMSDIRVGDPVLVGAEGVRVQTEIRTINPKDTTFEFMNSVVSSEKPQGLQVRKIAADMKAVKEAGKKILWVGGPGIVHTGSGPAMVALVDAGYVDVLFAGNALATHDIESNLYGTSLGVELNTATGVDHGHEHHIRAINRVRRAGSIAAAVQEGEISGGIMAAMVRNEKKFVLVGSVRDDGPLPDVITDVIEGQRAMRAALSGVGYAMMVATTLHSIATGNILPASIPLVCVDINPATVTKLADRGSAQAVGVVTDIGLLTEQLAMELVPSYRAG